MRVSIGLVLAAAVAANAHAQPNCTNPQDQATMNACAEQAYRKSDAELNRVYQSVTARVRNNNALSQKFVAAEQAWIAFRDAECGFSSAGVEGGSAFPAVMTTCLDDLTKARTESLQGYLSCDEGDLACPVPAK
ncbi:lysozyme inhibitor LprI family protein [Burkholderia guangdongensis]|uniref:lysozyme inhibitor LprI family protein n=1 Tax=Burkholderia guangdongensis TaxID=1792500 RepID=UPI0015CB63F3|nr:lysozyme inhibitor LprI family protein [Burkholderia guangdongensis]